jgi:transposase
MTRDDAHAAKLTALRQAGTVHLHPQRVTDPLFLSAPFFDAHDLVQVKYEMLRRVQADGGSITAAAAAFGFSRVAFYQAQAAFAQAGLPGLLPQRRGPRGAHKLTDGVLAFVAQVQAAQPALSSQALAVCVAEQFGVTVHPRSIERALARRSKKR